ncbi:MAG: hypothetical protein RIS44_3084 [Pseudomonadota bacterium]|jgi:predicted enzyme related to lactoylglutathione lyase
MTTPHDAITWFEIPVRELDRAQHFYEAVLERPMTRETIAGEQMALFAAAQAGVKGCINLGTEPVAPSSQGTRVYLDASPSLDAALARVQRAGGRVVTPKVALPEGMGFFAHIADTEGNVVGLHALAQASRMAARNDSGFAPTPLGKTRLVRSAAHMAATLRANQPSHAPR